jgi:RNA polymerase sigma factor (sigma-70 family)
LGKLVVVEPFADRTATSGPRARGDDELLAATAAGDAEAFGEFYRRHIAVVLGFLVRRTGSHELAADLAGETFAGALVACRRYRPGGAPAVAWLLGIAQNKLLESLRRGRVDQRVRERLGMPRLLLDDDGLERVQELAGQGRRALALLGQLPVHEREAVRGRVLEDREYRELAAELGLSEQVVRQRVSRGLKRLRALMEDRG